MTNTVAIYKDTNDSRVILHCLQSMEEICIDDFESRIRELYSIDSQAEMFARVAHLRDRGVNRVYHLSSADHWVTVSLFKTDTVVNVALPSDMEDAVASIAWLGDLVKNKFKGPRARRAKLALKHDNVLETMARFTPVEEVVGMPGIYC